MRTRSIVAIVLGATALLVVGGVLVVTKGGNDRRLGAFRTYSAGRLMLVADAAGGQYHYLGPLKATSGCRPRASVAVTPSSSTSVPPNKHISGVTHDACLIRFSLTGMEKELYDWINDTLARSAAPKGLWVVSADHNGTPEDVVHLTGAELAKVVFPELDASTKDPAYIDATLRATSALAPYPCCGSLPKSPISTQLNKSQKSALASNFKLEVGTLPGTRISHIDAWEVVNPPSGPLELGNLSFELSQADTGPWAQWFNDFVINGNNGSVQEKTGRLSFIDQTAKNSLAWIDFSGVGITYRAADVDTSEKVARDGYTLYVEDATLALAGMSTTKQSTTTTATTTTTTTGTTTTTPAEPPPPPKEEVKLVAPERLEARASGPSEVELQWNPVEGADSYVVLVSTNPKELFNEIATAEADKAPGVIIGRLKSGVTYYFVVRAVSGEVESEDSPVAEVAVE